ncbi:MAG: hypothetical protein R3E54_16445 [Halioglobus sp.]
MANRCCLSAALLMLLTFSGWTTAQPADVPAELSPEELDAAFTEADAAREAAGWSDTAVKRGPADPLGKMLQSADLVVRGVVTGQEVVYDARDTPFTHTTLAISEVLEGSYTGGEITIVQEGGPAKQSPENVLILSHTHYFTPGQEELLFLELNPDSPYPYSRVLIKKRFAVLNGKLFNENGRGLIYSETDEAPGYTLAWSRDRNPHPRFSEFKIGPHEFSKQFRQRDEEGESPGQPSSRSRADARPGYQEGVDISTFKQALNRQGG